MAAITLDIAGNTRQLDRDIQKTVNKVYTINLKTKGDQPLGRITGQINEFNKSLDASNARVIAFGASAGIIFGVERAFVALVKSTIEVQKSLQDINVILNASQAQLQKFGAELFSIARNTGQSFQEVAAAATEFSRQGLGVEETLKRTNEALILSRLSGLDAAKSVEALTAAVNSFASQSVTATEIVNKFATVDAAFAVSSADLADAISRVGSSAAQSGVTLNELIAIVTSAQQTTARGGAVIGNSFKTIFTRLQREKVVDLLGSLGISGTDASGQVKSTIQLLTELGQVYDSLGSQQQAYVAEQVGGVFQINILKAALSDLGKEYSIYNSALNVASGATDQAIRRNQELNKTYAAQINALQENAKQLAAAGGERLLGPSIDRLVGGTNTLLQGFTDADTQGVGAVLGKGILDGLGQFIAGPGLALIGGVLLKLFRDLGKFATGSFQQLLGLNTAATQQLDLQQSIQQILSKNPQLLELALKSNQGLNTAANTLLASLQKQTVELQRQAQVAAQISKAFVGQAGVRVTGGVPMVPQKGGKIGKASGYIPNFASDDFAREELLASALGARNPTAQLSKGTIDGKKFIKNNREIEITNFGKNGDSAVLPTYGTGFIPNFAKFNIGGKTFSTAQIPYAIRSGAISKEDARKAGYVSSSEKKNIDDKQKQSQKIQNLDYLDYVYLHAGAAGEGVFRSKLKDGNTGNLINFGFSTAGLRRPLDFKDEVNQIMGDALTKIAGQIYPSSKPFDGPSGLLPYIDKSATNQFLGRVFEASVNRAIGKDVSAEVGTGTLDIPPGAFSKNSKQFKEIFTIGRNYTGGDFKLSPPKAFSRKSSELSFASKIARTVGLNINPVPLTSQSGKPNKASGYIPNFAAIQDAVNRELAAGVPKNQIYLAQEKALMDANPMGIGVFNKRDEPNKNTRKDAMRRQGFASGYVPNFAETPDSGAASIGTAATAVAAQLSTFALTLALSKNEVKQSLSDLARSTKATASTQRNALAKDIKERRALGAPNEAIKQSLVAERSAARKAAQPSFGAKAKAFGGANALGIGIAAPILAQTISQAIPQETRGGRIAATGVGGLGNIAAGAATGAIFGPVGAAVGAAAAALFEIPNFVNSITTKVPELEKALTQSSTELTKFSDAGSRLLSSSSELEAAMSESVPSQEKISKLTEQFASALGDLSQEDQKRLKSAQKAGKLEEEYAKILTERTKELQGKEAALALQKSAEGLDGRIAATTGSENEKLLKTTFKNLITGGTQDEKALEAVQKSATAAIPQLEKLVPRIAMETSSADWFGSAGEQNIGNELRNILNQVIPESETKADQINAILATASQGPESLKNVIGDLINTYGEEARAIQNVIDIRDAEKQRITEETAARQKAQTAIDATISSIQKNIAVQNLWKSSLENITESLRSFGTDFQIGEQLTNPRATLENIIGGDADPVRRLTAQENLAKINAGTQTGLATAGINFKDALRSSIEAPFQENLNNIIKKLGESGGALEGSPTDIIQQSKEFQNQALKEQENLSKAMGNVEGLMSKFISGQLSSQQLLEASRTELSNVGIDINRGTKVSDEIEKAVAELNISTIQEQVKAFQQRAKIASETKQAILQDKINQALGVFGGFEGFMNRPEEEKNYIETIQPDLKKIQDIRSSTDFRYNNKESLQARSEKLPDLGRSFANVYKQLITQSGGAFREFIQKTVDRGRQSTGGRGGTGGTRGGFDDIISGREQDIKNQLKLAEDQLKVTTDPVLKRDLQGFIDSVKNLPGGTKGIATLQTMQEFGVARQSDYKDLYGKFESQSLERLKELSPELASSLSEAVTFGDPLLAETQVQSGIQTKILDVINKAVTESGIDTGIVPEDVKQMMIPETSAVGTPPTGTQTPKGSLPTGLQTYPGMPAAGPQAYPGAATIPKTTSQIEAETTIARDKARSMGMTLDDYRKEFPKGTPEMGPAPSPDYEKYKELNKPGQTFKSKDDMLLNFLQRLNFKETGKVLNPEQLGFGKKTDQKLSTQNQSFTQQEAALSSNTTALNALNENLKNLGTKLSEQNTGNRTDNQTPGRAAAITATQPNVTTTTNAPVNVVVNAQSSNDVSKAVGEAVQNAIPGIIEKVKLAMGQKVPPAINNRVTS
jgi:TP901 family phage tail tape measure protein